ncbi:hypothetical protein GCM10010252_35190 [Streptomyces aureoverticillatus]|nr:hypothetical protein GCM10010252_35190 [Streptomyces aureoverticillatus]
MQGPVAGGFRQGADGFQGEFFDWLAQEAACGSAQPGGVEAGGVGGPCGAFPSPAPSRNQGLPPLDPADRRFAPRPQSPDGLKMALGLVRQALQFRQEAFRQGS